MPENHDPPPAVTAECTPRETSCGELQPVTSGSISRNSMGIRLPRHLVVFISSTHPLLIGGFQPAEPQAIAFWGGRDKKQSRKALKPWLTSQLRQKQKIRAQLVFAGEAPSWQRA